MQTPIQLSKALFRFEFIGEFVTIIFNETENRIQYTTGFYPNRPLLLSSPNIIYIINERDSFRSRATYWQARLHPFPVPRSGPDVKSTSPIPIINNTNFIGLFFLIFLNSRKFHFVLVQRSLPLFLGIVLVHSDFQIRSQSAGIIIVGLVSLTTKKLTLRSNERYMPS